MSKRPLAITLFFLVLFIYLSNLLVPFKQTHANSDTFPFAFLPIAILQDHNLKLTRFTFLYNEGIPYYLVKTTDQRQIVSFAPPFGAFLELPVYAVAEKIGFYRRGGELAYIFLLPKISAAIVTAFSVILVFLSLSLLTKKAHAAIGTLIFAFASNIWTTTGIDFWQHTGSVFWQALFLYFLIRGQKQKKFLGLSALPLSFAAITRFTNFVPLIIVFLYILIYKRKELARFILAGLPAGAMLAVYNWQYFGNPLTLSYAKLVNTGGFFIYSLFEGLAVLLFSPSRGLLIFSPIFIFGFWGVYLCLRKKRNALFGLLTVIFFALVLLSASYAGGSGGPFFWGSRFATDFLVFFVPFFVFAFEKIFNHRLYPKIIFLTLFIYSIFIQILGAYFYKMEWDNYYWQDKSLFGNPKESQHILEHLRKTLWNIKDSQIPFTFRELF